MRAIQAVFPFLFFVTCVNAQTAVDRLVNTLDSLSLLSFDEWKVSPDLRDSRFTKGDPTRPDFDDSMWKVLKLNESIYVDSCWIRKEIVLPERILGEPMRGSVKFLVSVDDYGYLWVNGESKGYFPWDGEFLLTHDARPGQKFVIAIKAINTGGPLRLLRASFESEQAKPTYDLISEVSLSLRVAQRLLSFDTYQTNARRRVDPMIDKSGMNREEKLQLDKLLQNRAAQFNPGALVTGNMAMFRQSVASLKESLKPVAEFCKRFTLHLVSNAHIDAAWLWRQQETVEVCRNTFISVLNMMDSHPEFTYVQSAAAYYRWMEEQYPDIFRRMNARVQEGRWEIVGGMWVEPDCNLPSGESWSRHLLYSKRYFKEKLKANVTIGWNPDSFGYNWNMPQLYREAGIDAFITQKIGWSEHNVFPYRVFWWQAPDSSRILTYFPFDYVNELTDPFELTDELRQFEANTGFTKMMVLFGVGDHGGGPSDEMLERVEKFKKLDMYPKIEFGTVGQYLSWLRQQDLAGVPVWNDELYLEYHQGTFTTQAAMKQFNRRNEVLLTNAEKVSTLATLVGRPYQGETLEEGWRRLLFNQFHDILPGSGIREVYIDATESHREAELIGRTEMQQALQAIAADINTSKVKDGLPVVVFNPLSWERTDIVEVPLPSAAEEFAVFEANGKEIPSQVTQRDRYTRGILFVAREVPSIGYKVYTLKKKKGMNYPTSLRTDATSVESNLFRVTVDPETGWLNSIIDKRNGHEVLNGEGNRLLLLEDKPSAWDAWNIGLTGVEYPSRLRKIEIVESGPVRAVLRIHRDYRKQETSAPLHIEKFPTTFFSQDIILYDGLDQVFFRTDVDWWEEKTMVKVAFPLAVSDTVATYEIPFGYIERSTRMQNSWDSAKVEVPAHRWADLSGDDYGVSLLNKAKYGHDIKGNVMRLSLLRSPNWPDPTADRGKHSIEYALYPHRGRWQEASTVQRGYGYNNPLIALITDSHKGKMPPISSFVRITPSNLVVTTIKKAEDSDAWVIQFYDSQNQRSNALLELPMAPKKAMLSNFLEEDGPLLTTKGKTVKVPTGARAVVTIKVEW